VWDVGAGRERDAELFRAVGVLVVLSNSLADFGGGDADDGIGGSVVACIAAEDFDAEGALLELVPAAFELFVDDKAKKTRKPLAMGKMRVVEEAIELAKDIVLLRFAINSRRNALVTRHDFIR
jgi:hypothetical protein